MNYYIGNGVRFCQNSKPLIVSGFESNSGGFALNSDLTPQQLSPQPQLPFWNVDDEVFEPLHIGVNNNLQHAGSIDSTTHGWECRLAELVENRNGDVCYLQAGQGGSRAFQWDNVGDTYYDEMVDRITKAVAAEPRIDRVVFWMTLGINDAIAQTPTPEFESRVTDLITLLLGQPRFSRLVIAELPTEQETGLSTPQMAFQDDYNTIYRSIASANTNVVTVPVNGLSLRDRNHWDSPGIKGLGSRMFSASGV